MEERKEEVKKIDLNTIKNSQELKAIAYDLTEQIALLQQQLQMVRARLKQIA